MRRFTTAAVAVTLATASFIAAGCSSNAWSSRSASRNSELTEIKQRIIALERQQAMLTVELRHLRDELAAQGPQGAASASAQPADHPAQAQSGMTPKSAQAGGVEETTLPVASTSKRPASEPSPEEPVSESAANAPTPTSPVPSTAASAHPVSAAGQALYDRGYTQYHQGHYRDAEATFERFLSHYAKTDLGDNALYWIGESRYSLGEYEKALTAFKQTVERYPNGNKVPDALLKAGQCLEQLGNKKGARTTYEEVVRRFAGTTAATLASERLHALR